MSIKESLIVEWYEFVFGAMDYGELLLKSDYTFLINIEVNDVLAPLVYISTSIVKFHVSVVCNLGSDKPKNLEKCVQLNNFFLKFKKYKKRM